MFGVPNRSTPSPHTQLAGGSAPETSGRASGTHCSTGSCPTVCTVLVLVVVCREPRPASSRPPAAPA
eukprot:11182863-Heterocapsa_arctica.AAC.1